MEQTTVTDSNRDEFFKTVYSVQTFDSKRLLDIGPFKDKKIVAIDSCGFYYEQVFFKIFKIEYVHTAKEYKLTAFDRLFNKVENISEKADVLLLDHCPELFKYKSEIQLKNTLKILTTVVDPTHCLVRMDCATLGDDRLNDRFKNLCSIIPDNYVVDYLNYNRDTLSFKLLKKHEISIN
jgi:hypothetical protein